MIESEAAHFQLLVGRYCKRFSKMHALASASSSAFDHVVPPSDVHDVNQQKKQSKNVKKSKKSQKKSKKSKRSNKSSNASMGSCSNGMVRSESSSSGKKRSKAKKAPRKVLSWLELDTWETRNVQCQVCDIRDSDMDEVFGDKKCIWGYPPILNAKTGQYRTQGLACFYCNRLQMAYFYPEIRIKEMKGKMGADPKLHEDMIWQCILV